MAALLTWTSGVGRAAYGGVMVDIYEQPRTGFEYAALYYEPETGMLLKITEGGAQVRLTPEEQAACALQAQQLVDAADYPVQAFDADGVYRGTVLRSAAVAQRLEYCLDPPDHPASKRVGKVWRRIAAVIMEDGRLNEMPDSVCQLCLLTFTAEEWANHAHPATAYETWDFAAAAWRDKRSLDAVRAEAKALIRRVMENVRKRWLENIPDLERQTWQRQEAEAKAWVADNTVATPFVDAVLMGRGTVKAALCADIIANADKAWQRLARAHALQWAWFDRVDACAAVADVDAVVFALGDADLEA